MFEESSTISQSHSADLTRGEFLKQLDDITKPKKISEGLDLASQYLNATGFLLLRNDGSEDAVISSNWPYDLAKQMSSYLLKECAITGHFSDEYPAFEANFLEIPDEFLLPRNISKQACVLPVSSGDSCFLLSFLFAAEKPYSRDRLIDVGLACAYLITEYGLGQRLEQAQSDLTEREMECLSWISKGKTSDEIAVIIGISKNTVNNYITSIMNKTATKSRAEAVAEAVRSEII